MLLNRMGFVIQGAESVANLGYHSGKHRTATSSSQPYFCSKLLKKWLFLRLLKNAQMQGSRNSEE
jgi:hypothetical protein